METDFTKRSTYYYDLPQELMQRIQTALRGPQQRCARASSFL